MKTYPPLLTLLVNFNAAPIARRLLLIVLFLLSFFILIMCTAPLLRASAPANNFNITLYLPVNGTVYHLGDIIPITPDLSAAHNSIQRADFYTT